MKTLMKASLSIAVILALAAALYAMLGGGLLPAYDLGVARRALQSGNIPRAEEYYGRYLAKNPSDASARAELIAHYYKRGNLTKTEFYLLEGISYNPGYIDFYKTLSNVYVQQDKLLDAVSLLDGIKSDVVVKSMNLARPAAPKLTPSPGRYDTNIQLNLEAEQGQYVYFSLDGEYPSVVGGNTGAIALPRGKTSVMAVAVDSDGLVSKLSSGEYTIENVRETVVFKDNAVEAILRRKLEKPYGDISSGELWDITSLSNLDDDGGPIGGDIESLEDLSYLRSLRELRLSNLSGGIDWGGLSALPRLRVLSLTDCGISSGDLSKLAALPALEELTLAGNRISSLTPLEAAKSLKSLDLERNNIVSIDALISLSELRTLRLGANPLGDLSALCVLKKLEELDLSGCGLKSILTLSGMKGLRSLDISGNRLTDISALSRQKELSLLSCGNNKIRSLDPLSGQNQLSELYADSNELADVSALSGLAALSRASLRSNGIRALPELKGCAALSYLDVSDNMIVDLTSVKSAPALLELDIRDNLVSTLAPALESASLVKILASGNPVSDSEKLGSGRVEVIY